MNVQTCIESFSIDKNYQSSYVQSISFSIDFLSQLVQYYKLKQPFTYMNRVNQKYAYISHPDNLPLELNGNAKKKSTPIIREQYNATKADINADSRSFLLKKISHNVNNLDNNKSIVPTDIERKRSRPNSIKIFKNDPNDGKVAGVELLMNKTQNMKPTNHKQKGHVGEIAPTPVKRPEKKHFQNQNIIVSQISQPQRKGHKQTIDLKIANDIYSNVYRIENEPINSKRIETANMFRNGEELGLEKCRNKKVSTNKMIEMIGSGAIKDQKGGLRERRQDWRTSNINFF